MKAPSSALRLPLPAHLAILLTATPALANVMWPALVMEQRLSAPWVILLGLAIEYAMLRRIFGFPPKRALIATVAANAASAPVGFLGRPFLGAVWSLVPSVAGMGTFGLIDWAGTFVVALIVNVLVEGLVYRFGFGLPLNRRTLLWLALANAATLAIAYASTEIMPLDW